MAIAGLDIGSVATKCVVVDGGRIIGTALVRTGTDTEKAAAGALAGALQQARLERAGLEKIVSTGYGRRQCGLADRVITEISAAGAGAFRMNGGRPGLVVDIGGQDTKVIEINGGGAVSDFLMNDKCAAGTGRFLELMAQVLETDMEGFSELAQLAEAPRRLNATCSVFAESEVVSLIAHGESKMNIAAGLFEAVASRVAAMLRQFQDQPVFFCGGGARSPALRLALERLAGRPVQVLDPPQFVVAFGAAMLPDGV